MNAAPVPFQESRATRGLPAEADPGAPDNGFALSVTVRPTACPSATRRGQNDILTAYV